MSREILFRGKRTDNGEWVEGFYANRIEECLLDAGKHYILTCDAYGFSWYEVDPDTVGQYIGLTDKNGKRIFEGNIVKIRYTDNGCVVTETTRVGYDYKFASYFPFNWQYSCDGCDCSMKIELVEIIGNIHDNPELVGV